MTNHFNPQTTNRRQMLQSTGMLAGASMLAGFMPQWAAAQSDNALKLLAGVTWINQSAFRIQNGDQIIYIDPYQISGTPADADLILITHPHGDHCDVTSLQRLVKDDTQIYAETDSMEKIGSQVQNVSPIVLGDKLDIGSVHIETLRAYNNTKTYHPKANDWLGYILTLQDGRKIYHGGDTDFITEMEGLETDVAILPIGGTYTMEAVEAAEAIRAIKPKLAVPMHWGGPVGNETDAAKFASELSGQYDVLVLSNGQSIPPIESAIGEWNKK